MRSVLNKPENLASRFQYWLVDHGDSIFVLCVYILITILFTWPLVLNFTTYVNGQVQDIFHELWYLHLGRTSPYGPFFQFYTNSVWWPTGVLLFFQVTSPFNTLVFMAISPIVGEVAAYNSLVMFSLFAAGFFTYIFVNYLTRNKYAAFFSGLIFAFAPFHLSQELSHLNIMSSEFLPLYSYYLIKLLRERRLRNSIYAGAGMVLNAMCDIHFLLLAIAITIAFLLYYLLVRTRAIANKPFLIRFGIMSSLSALLGIFVYFQTFYGLFFVPQSLGLSSAQEAFITARSSDLLSFLVPSAENPIFRAFTYRAFLTITPLTPVPISAGRDYIGYSVILFSLFGLISNRKKDVWFWGFLTIVGILISLGPFIRIGGKVTPIAGLWNWLYFLFPFVNAFRAPERFDYIIMLGLAVLSGYGVRTMLSAISKGKKNDTRLLVKKYVIVALLCTVLVIEYIQVPNVEMSAQIPPIYQILASDHSNYTVLEVPVFRGYSAYLYYQSTYNHPLVNGGVPRTPQYPLIFAEGTPFINQLGQYSPGHSPSPDIINQTMEPTQFPQIARFILAQYNIKYIIVHKNLFVNKTGTIFLNGQPAYIQYVNLISSVVGAPFYQDSQIIAFRFNPPPGSGIMQYLDNKTNNARIFSLLTGEWYPYSFFVGPTRAMQVWAGLNMFSASDQYVQVSFRVSSPNFTYPLQLSLNGRVVGNYLANKYVQTYSTPFLFLHRGLNQLTFYSLNGCSTPPTRSPVSVLIQSAQRTISCSSAQFSWIDPILVTTNA